MRSPLRFALVCVVAILLLVAPGGSATAELPVTVTLHPLALLAREVGGDDVAVQVLVPPGASPHTFEPRPSDVARLSEAALLVRSGGGDDAWASRLAAAAPQLPMLVLAEALEARMPEVPHTHAWLDPIAVRDALAPALAERLADIDPTRGPAHARRLTDFQARLSALHRELEARFAGAQGRSFVAFHGAWDAFAQRYGLRVAAEVEPSPGQEPSPRALAELVETARRLQVPAILVEPQLPSRVAEVLAREFGGTTVLADPLGDPDDPQRNSYEELLRFNAGAIQRALGGGDS